jgi:hypothetical protein
VSVLLSVEYARSGQIEITDAEVVAVVLAREYSSLKLTVPPEQVHRPRGVEVHRSCPGTVARLFTVPVFGPCATMCAIRTELLPSNDTLKAGLALRDRP